MQEGESGAVRPISEAEDIGPFRLASAAEVGFVLRTLAQRNDFVSIYFNSGRDMLLTRILDVDIKARTFVFDLSGHAQSNAALTKTDKAVFVATPDGVKIQFSTSEIRQVDFEGRPAFRAPFPPDLIKLQRRDFFRLPTPISNPYCCRLPIGDGDSMRLDVLDISLGGVGVRFSEAQVGKIEIGLKFSQVEFDFGPGGVMRINVEVRNRRAVVNRQGQTQYAVGMRFLGLSRAQEASLQRLISQLERERKALLG
ncbi:c-di-GMP-binding flagellar brake protein YcgR, contains PilZNR and PilZ domains [Formivibrio citricus]|uniref:Flagellar brake protein YcgR n=1 Tax=Formivibrio citricus TaxID=83765 RepID=A0A1I4ZSY3_9NEIS|nr:flagellar brake protein [Formivibrio citricus]SFN53298.1 c-di-GMP-binding flagellar brake protein YcgR, contains PilZNR and PilZ domains [Formivibrio citricus]